MTTSNQESEIIESPPNELGAMLINYRESAGFSITQAADALCLSETTINYLENQTFDKLPEPPYVRGYLRSYAKMADKPADELIATYEKLRGASPEELTRYIKPSPMSRSKPTLSPVLARLIVLGALVAVLAGISMIPGVTHWIGATWNSFSQQGNNQSGAMTENPLLTGSMPTPLPMPGDNASQGVSETHIEGLSNQNDSVENNTTANASSATIAIGLPGAKQNQAAAAEPTKSTTANRSNSPTVTESNATATSTIASTTIRAPGINSQTKNTGDSISDKQKIKQTQQAGDQDKTTQSTNENNPRSVKIKLVFNEEVWLRIRDKEKKTVYEGQTPAGKEKVLDLERPLTFRVGNAQGISIFVDGKPKDISNYIRGSIANFTIQ